MVKRKYIKEKIDAEALTSSENLPDSFKISRDATLQLSKIERDLFTDMEERQSGNYIISGIEKNITALDFTAFTFAVGQILYNQSYKSGNADINSGIKRQEAKEINKLLRDKHGLKEDLYCGNISTSLNELCRLAYGTEPSTELKKKMATLIDTIDQKAVFIKYPNEDILETKLCAKMIKYTRKEDGAVFYNLQLNPIFGSRIRNQFGELPQDITAKLSEATRKKTAAHYLLLRWLSAQDKRHPHPLTIDKIIQELRMEEFFRKDRGKADKQLHSVCDAMVKIGILSKYEAEYSSGKRSHIKKITFYLNPIFIRDPKRENL